MRNEKGFTLIEIVMVIILLGFLAAAALPRFIDLSDEAQRAGTQGVLGGVRGGIAIFYANTALNGGSGARYPGTLAELQGSMADGRLPDSPYSADAAGSQATLNIDVADPPARIMGAKGAATDEWMYNVATGQFWSGINGPAGGPSVGANAF